MKRYTLITTDGHGEPIETFHSDSLPDIVDTLPEFVRQIDNVARGNKDPFDLRRVQILDHCPRVHRIMYYSVADSRGL